MNILIVVSIRKSKDIVNWVSRILEARSTMDLWLVTDKISIGILVAGNIVSKGSKFKVIVFSSELGEEDALRIIKDSKPRMVYMCDEGGVFSKLIELVLRTNIEKITCNIPQ